jgi:methionine-rich copper-binding protein CopC
VSHVALAVRVLVFLAIACGLAEARALHVRNSTPDVGAIIDGHHAQYVVRFDGPVDHAASRLYITQDHKVVESLVVLLDSAPDVLFSSGATLAAGHYNLHWYAKSAPDSEVVEGDIPFSVAP